MAAILMGRSKPKCLKLATSKGSSEWRISKGIIDGHFTLIILCTGLIEPFRVERSDCESHTGLERQTFFLVNYPFKICLR